MHAKSAPAERKTARERATLAVCSKQRVVTPVEVKNYQDEGTVLTIVMPLQESNHVSSYHASALAYGQVYTRFNQKSMLKGVASQAGVTPAHVVVCHMG